MAGSAERVKALDILKDRGFIQQMTNEEGLRDLMEKEPVTFYVGIDPTGTSLHIGHLVPLFVMAHLAEAGHNPIVIVGGGTARIGDPSGKTEMRRMISVDTINRNAAAMGRQIESFLQNRGCTFSMVNNADWLADLNYIEFLRDIGRHFSVNRMLSFETYKMRLETGLSFIEFNYQLLQSYDFLELYRRNGCRLQIGGDDQWGNIVAGADLIRRVEGTEAFGATMPLVTRADGKKMGKTEQGAVFLDPEQFSPYDFYQYWRNVPDQDVRRFLLFYTFMPVSEVDEITSVQGQALNTAKERLAWEVTALIHGEEEAGRVRDAARAVFQGAGGADDQAVPSKDLEGSRLSGAGIGAIDLFVESGLCSSKGEARRLIQQGGARINDRKVDSIDSVITEDWIDQDALLLRAGKKRFFKFAVKG